MARRKSPSEEPSTAVLDLERSLEALELAEAAIGLSEPNPRVGCVIGRDDGTVLGRGHTQQAGAAHAEVAALSDAAANGSDVRGATAWVSLEPCAHHGRTPPCCIALADAGIARVVIALPDPNPVVNGRGADYLRARGVRVDQASAHIEQLARELNIGFVVRHQRGRPWVRVKAGQSLDGRIALADGRSRWITCAQSREDGQSWRRRAGAIVTGIGTVLADDPRLDCRVGNGPQPLRVVLDSRWRTPTTARLLSVPGPVLIVGVDAEQERRVALSELAETLIVDDVAGQVSLPAILGELNRRQVNEVHVEAGSLMNGALLRGGLVDEWLLYIAPRWLGDAHPVAALPMPESLPVHPEWAIVDTLAVGTDLRLRLRRFVSASRQLGVDWLDRPAIPMRAI